MPVPSNVGDLNPNPAANSPTGNETVGPNLDDYLRSGFAFTRQIAAGFAGDTAPNNPFPYMLWADTATGYSKRRNAAGTDWVTEAALFRPVLSGYAIADLPTADVGDIFVPGVGIHRFKYGRYALDSFPPRHRSGGVLTSTATSVTVAAGSWRGAANDVDIILGASLSKNLQASGAWAAGSGSNGIVGGVAATSTWYHVHVIRQDSTGAIDVCLDTSPIAANRPAGWSAYRRIGAVFNQSSGGVRPFVQSGTEFRYLAPVNNLNNSALSNTSLTVATVSTPLGVQTRAYIGLALTAQSAAAFGFVFTPGDTDRSVLAYANVASSPSTVGVGSAFVMTDGNSQINSRGAGSIPSGFYLSTNGYTDFIGD
ncbi:hypothetical protein [Achromobacter xylosoxidans]|uniref:hypothetical protein n=1 Tax=Alcaligenes xylosoxydans xylosoxydans TaxID=85698 RepID=UPI001061CCC4|nr:hypothetical protein [Achromobacter xylosoxidans]